MSDDELKKYLIDLGVNRDLSLHFENKTLKGIGYKL